MTTTPTFIRNAWYVAARSEEVGDKPLGRTICNEKIVLFRGKDGIAAVEDFARTVARHCRWVLCATAIWCAAIMA